MNSFIFCLFDSAFIFLYFWRILFLGLEFYVKSVSLCILKMSLHWLLTFIVSIEMSALHLFALLLKVTCLFSPDALKISPSSLVFLAAYYDKTKFSILIYPVWSLLSIMNL